MNTQQQLSSFFFINLFIALFLAVAYNTITNMAGLYITSALGGSIEISVYSMVFFGVGTLFTIPLAHPLADRFGTIKVLVYSLILYAIFSLFCARSSTYFFFNTHRFMLGVASGPIYILCRKLIIGHTSLGRLNICSTMIVLCFSISPILGACFGAWLAYEGFWRWIFYVNILIALVLAGYFWHYFKDLEAPLSSPLPFDTVGYLFFSIGVGALVTALTLAQQLDWYRSMTIVVLLLIALPSLIFFIIWELNHPHPAIALNLLRTAMLSYALINMAILFATYFGMIILISLWLNIYVNYTPLWIAVLIGAMGIAGVIGYFISKNILRYFDPRLTLAVAILVFASSCYYSTYFDVEIDFFHLAIARSLAGLGLVLFLFPVFKLAYASCDSKQGPNIFCLLQLTRSLFSSLGAALFVILWQRRQIFFHERLAEGLTVYSQLTSNYFQRAHQTFDLTTGQSTEQLNIFLDQQATSLGLNDAFGFMGYILLGLLLLLVFSFPLEKIYTKRSI